MPWSFTRCLPYWSLFQRSLSSQRGINTPHTVQIRFLVVSTHDTSKCCIPIWGLRHPYGDGAAQPIFPIPPYLYVNHAVSALLLQDTTKVLSSQKDNPYSTLAIKQCGLWNSVDNKIEWTHQLSTALELE